MLSTFTPLLLISFVVLLLVMLLIWSYKRTHSHPGNLSTIETRNDILIWLLVLAAFMIGVFVAYVLISLPAGGG
jgi:hypothetical protein